MNILSKIMHYFAASIVNCGTSGSSLKFVRFYNQSFSKPCYYEVKKILGKSIQPLVWVWSGLVKKIMFGMIDSMSYVS